jgi:tRNA uridine 5-carboxymethylaminomethyl modification enzyme
MLREDNADLRLTEAGRELGVVDDHRWALFRHKKQAIEAEQSRLSSTWLHPNSPNLGEIEKILGGRLASEVNMLDLLKRPEMNYYLLMTLPGAGEAVADETVAAQVEIQAKYAGYIDRQHAEVEKHRTHEELRLPDGIEYSQVRGLSNEVITKLNDHRPATLGQASRISGVTPAAISLLLVHLKSKSA